MNLHNRLRRLEQAVGTGCPACRDRRGVVVVRRRRQGMSLPWDEPAPCPRCGEVPEQILEIEEDRITMDSDFATDLDADSLALIELVEALEEELGERTVGFRIEDEDLEDLKTVRDAVDYVYARVNDS